MVDGNGYRSGYTYDYLQEMARYGGWRYEYVSGTIPECLEMLENGEIDLMGAMMYSDERAKTMDFSKLSMGENFSILTVRADEHRYRIDSGKEDLDGIHIGVLDGDSRQAELEKYAQKAGFTYKTTKYDTITLLEKALEDKKVDAILTTNMRVSSGKEKMIAQFAPADFYFVTQKGNSAIMNAIDTAMEQIEFARKDFQSSLSQRYFSVDMSGSLTFTDEEMALIKAHPQIRVVLPAMRKPMAYFQNGVYKGIIVDIINDISKSIGVSVKYIEARSQEESINMVLSGQADMIANAYNDCGWAEMNHLFLSRPYMTMNYASIAQVNTDLADPNLRVAAVRGYRFSRDFIEPRYSADRIIWYNNETECVEAVKKQLADVCFVNTYVAAECLHSYKYRALYSSIIGYSHGVCAGVPASYSPLLLSIMDKGIASMGDERINDIILENTMLQMHKLSFPEQIQHNPLPFTIIVSVFSFVIIAMAAMLISSKSMSKKNQELYMAKLAAERDALTGLYNRTSFELLVEELQVQNVQNHIGAFVMMDIDNFKHINDENGHSFGDKVLMAVSHGMEEMLRGDSALLCRMGGDEFAMFFPKIVSKEDVWQKLQSVAKELGTAHDKVIPVSCSFGIAFTEQHNKTLFSDLYETADTALYEAKRGGKGMICVAP
ncbi:MAG: GGDEF domain-containing protein, partial [Angelakisella sp.]